MPELKFSKTYRHRTIRRFKIGKFEFKEHLLVINNEADDELFHEHLKGDPRSARDIVELNPEAMAAMEKSVDLAPKVIRGAQDSGQIPSGVKESDGKAIAASTPGPNQQSPVTKNPADVLANLGIQKSPQ